MYGLTVKRPVAISMVVIGVVVFGIIAYQQLPLNLMPQMSYPRLTIRTEYPGSGPEEVEVELSRQIESILGTVSHLSRITSRSKAGLSEVIVEFDWRAKLDMSMQEVREKLDMVRLPEGAKKPIPLRYDPNLDPMMRIGLYNRKKGQSNDPNILYKLRLYAEETLRPALETLAGVAAVKIRGGFEQEVVVALDENKLRGLGLQIQSIVQRLKEANINLAGGQLKEGTTYYWVRTLNEFISVEDMRSLLIARRDNRLIYLRDIAQLSIRNKAQEVITHINGSSSVELSIYREADANIVEVSKRIRERIFGTQKQRMYVRTFHSPKKKKRLSRTKHRRMQRLKNSRTSIKRRKKGSTQGKTNRKGVKRRKKYGTKGYKARYKAMRAARRKKRFHRHMTRFLQYQMPDTFGIQVLTDQSVFIQNSIDEVLDAAIMGGGFAIFVLLLFMRNLWGTVIIGLSIPLSVVATFGGLYLSRVSLNIMSLGGLALGIGMLVDNSIVVLESILRYKEEGHTATQAAIRGVSEVGSAVIASTLTTVAVFFPIVFVQGVAGQLLRDLALTVVFSLVSSLIVSLFFIPMLSALGFSQSQPAPSQKGQETASRWLAWSRLIAWIQWWKTAWQSGSWTRRVGLILLLLPSIFYGFIALPIQSILEFLSFLIRLVFRMLRKIFRMFWKVSAYIMHWLWMPIFWATDQVLRFLHWAYPAVLRSALQQRVLVLAAGMGLMLYTYTLFPQLKREFMPKVHQGEFNLELRFPVGTPLKRTLKHTEVIEALLQKIPTIESFTSVLGVEKSEIQNSDKGEHTASLTLQLKKSSNIQASELQTIQQIRKQLEYIPGLKMKVVYPSLFTLRSPIEIELYGENLSILRRLAREVMLQLRTVPGLRDIQSNAASGLPEIQIQFDREQLLRYDLTVQNVANAIRSKLYGSVATRFRRREQRLDVLVRVRQKQLDSVQSLHRLTIISPKGTSIPLKQVARFKVDEGPAEITRVSNRRAVQIRAELEGMALGEAKQAIEDILERLKKPVGYKAGLSGQSEEMERSLRSLLLALLLSIFLVYLVMASQFESLLSPLVILFSIPLAFVGVVLFFAWTGQPVSSMVLIGMIILTGIVVNNAIVLVDAIGKLRQEGIPVIQAIEQAGLLRLRPILMTTATTVLGLLPLALGLGEGAELRRPMAITLIIGLLGSTILTLVIIPVLYHVVSKERTFSFTSEHLNPTKPSIGESHE